MPFPLAHPAAILPLRRFCPRHLNLPALVIGSLTPDFGYAFGHYNLEYFSHRPLAGTFGFCLPVGLGLGLAFYLVRLPVVRRLPMRHRRAFLPLCQRPAGPQWRICLQIIVSLLIGAMTHQVLDALTHPELWLLRYVPVLVAPVLAPGLPRFLVCELLYTTFTFAGMAWLALVYLRWWARAAGAVLTQGRQWACSLLTAGCILGLTLACHGTRHGIGFIPAGIGSVLLVIGFMAVSSWGFRLPWSRK